jgi:hypothetical protein
VGLNVAPTTTGKSILPVVSSRFELKQDDIEYAIENTQVILAPERQIASFGNTSFEFHLISELMDRVDQVRIRTGRIEAERPKILSPEYFCRMMLEGFGERAQEYVDRLREQARQIAVFALRISVSQIWRHGRNRERIIAIGYRPDAARGRECR